MSGENLNLEALVLGASPTDAFDLSPLAMAVDFGAGVAEAAAEAVTAAPEIISPEIFMEQWGLLHDMGGAMISMRTGNPCDLGTLARGGQGQIAGRAAYDLLALNPALARVFLGTQNSYLGQIAAVGMHGFAVVQAVKASRAPTVEPPADMSGRFHRNAEA